MCQNNYCQENCQLICNCTSLTSSQINTMALAIGVMRWALHVQIHALQHMCNR